MTGFRNLMTGAAGAAGAGGFAVDNSALFNDDDSGYLTRTPSSAGNQKKWTLSFWFKFGSVTGRQMFYAQDEAYIDINENSSTSALINIYLTGVSPVWYWETVAMFRDPHAWYHVVVAFDSANSTVNHRLRLYINGEEITSFTKHSTGNQDVSPDIGGTSAMVIGAGTSGTPAGFFDGYFAEYVYVNGSQLAPTSFGETDSNGVWRPIDVSGLTFGTNGFYLPFTGSGALGADYSATRTAPSVSFLTSAYSTSNAQNYTFSSQSLGTAASNRKIIACVGASAVSVSTLSISSVTIGGVTATQLVAGNADNNNSLQPFAIFIADVPSGTTGDVVVSLNAANGANCAIALYRATEVGPTIYSDATNGGSFPSPNTVSLAAQASKNSIILSHGVKNGQTVRVTLAGVTETYDFGGEDDMAIFGGINTSATSSDAVGVTTSATVDSGSASYLGIATIVIGGVGDTSFKAVNSPTQTTDSPTKNYAVLSPLSLQANIALSEGNLKQVSSSNSQGMSLSSFPVKSGQKVYIEATLTNTGGETGCLKATATTAGNPSKTFDDLDSGDARLLNVNNGDVFTHDGTALVSNYAPNDTNPTTHMIALDLVNDKIYWGDAGVGANGWSNGSGSYNQAFSSAVGVDLDANLDWFFAFKGYNATIAVNFGQTAFTVSPPTGYSSGYSAAIENENRETALTIEDGSAYHQSTLYTGNTGTQEINQTGNSTFKPDLLWLAGRESYPPNLSLYDSLRSTEANPKRLTPNENFSQHDDDEGSGNKAFKSFDVDGFSFQGGGNNSAPNANTKTMVAWQWKAGGEPTVDNSAGQGATPTAGSVKIDGSNLGSALSGSIPATRLSANTTAGFSIVTWTGTGGVSTVAHGLGQKPNMIFVKNLDDAEDWVVYHDDVGFNALPLNTSGQRITTGASVYWNDTAHTSLVFNVNSHNGVNGSSDKMIAYCFSAIPGYSAIGKYVGNGNSTDGPFVHTGFSPSWIFVRAYDDTSNAAEGPIHDFLRDPINPMDKEISVNRGGHEDNNQGAPQGDFLSNGFKIGYGVGTTGGGMNISGVNYVYLAFAKNPFAATTPATAR